MAESFSVKAILSAQDRGFTSAFKSAMSSANSLKSTLTSGIGFGIMAGIGRKHLERLHPRNWRYGVRAQLVKCRVEDI